MSSIGPYELLGELGRGAMGAVFRARDPSGHDVALKLLSDPLDDQARARFEREGEALSALRHPHVVAFHKLGFERGRAYLAMELVEGTTLQDRLRHGPLDWVEALLLGQRLASALAHAHDRGVLHRDLKPANILLRPDGQPVLTDFGIARRSGARSMTATGQLLGTPTYMSPEQALALKRLTPATDVFSLGATLYEAVTGARPFVGSTALATLIAVRTEAPAPLSDHVEDLPPAVEALIFRCLEKEPTARPSALELRDSCARLLAGEEAPSASGQKGWLVGGAALLAVTLALGVAALTSRAPSSPTSATTPSPEEPPAGVGAAAADRTDDPLLAALREAPPEDWRRRQRLLEQLVALRPHDAGLHLDHAQVLLDAERYDLGVAAVASALATPQPDRARADRLRLELELRRGRYREAHALARTLLRRAPDDSVLTLATARSLVGMGQYSAAEEAFGQLERDDDPGPWRVDHANLLRLQGKTRRALQAMKRALQQHPRHLRTRLEALYLRVPPLSPAEFMRRSRDLRAEFGPRPSVLAAVAYAHQITGRKAAAREQLEAALAIDPGQQQALGLRILQTANGRGFLSRAQMERVLRDASTAAERDPTVFLSARANYLTHLGRPQEALGLLRDALETPGLVLARAKAQRGLLLLSAAPDPALATLLLASCTRARDLASAHRLPSERSARLLRAEALAFLDRWPEARREASRLIQTDGAELGVAHLLRALRLLKTKALPGPRCWVAGTEADLARARRLITTRPAEALHLARGVARATPPSSPLHASALMTAAWAASQQQAPGLARGTLALFRATSARDPSLTEGGVKTLALALNPTRARKSDSVADRIAHTQLLLRVGSPASALEEVEALAPTPKRPAVWLEYLRTLAFAPRAKRRAVLETALRRADRAGGPELGALGYLLASLVQSATKDGPRVTQAEALAKAARAKVPSDPFALAALARLQLLEAEQATPDVAHRKAELLRAVKGYSLAAHQIPLGRWFRQRARALLALTQLESASLDQSYSWSRFARADLLRSLGRGVTDDLLWTELAHATHISAKASPEPAVQAALRAQALHLFERGLRDTPWKSVAPGHLLAFFEACCAAGATKRARAVARELLPLLRQAGRTKDEQRITRQVAELAER